MIQIGLYSAINGQMIVDVSPRASGVIITSGEHGYGTLACFVKMALAEAFQLYDRPGLPYMQASEYGFAIFQGRLEDVDIVDGGVTLTAYGCWRALGDSPYTGLWSYSGTQDWRPTSIDDHTNRTPEKYAFDSNNRLYCTLTKNTIYTNNADVGEQVYFAPSGGSQKIEYVSVSYDYNLPTNWVFRMRAVASDWSGLGTTNFTTVGGTATGTATLNVSGSPAPQVIVEVFNNTGGNYTDTSETGVYYAKLTNVVIKGSASASIYADEIARALVSFINSLNSGQLSSSTALIQSPAVALTNEIYQDRLPSDILDHLAALGDNSSPVSLYETGVWEGQQLSFQKRGATARQWFVDVSALEVSRTLNALYNSVYADYQEASGRTLRTAVNDDAGSQTRYGLARRRMIATQTTSGGQAGTSRDAALQDGKDPRPRVLLAFERVYDAAGNVWPLWAVRAWDTMTIRNLPPTLSTAIDRIRTFRIIETSLDVDHQLLTVTPEQFIPSLDVLTARLAAGIRR